MEYEKLYIEKYNENFNSFSNLIKNKLVDYCGNELNYSKATEEIFKLEKKLYKESKFNYEEPYTTLYGIFEKHKKDYKRNFIEKSLNLNVKPYFEELKISNYTFEDLVKDLACEYSKIDVFRILRNQHELYSLIYNSEDFSEFEIKEYDTVLENTEIFKKYKNLVYPNTKNYNENIENEPKNTIANSITKEIENNSSIKKETKLPKEDKTKIILTNEENCLLIYLFKSIMLEGGFKTDAELYKVLSLIQIKKLSEFGNKDSYRSTNEYRALSGKINNINLDNIEKNLKYQLQEFKYLLDDLSTKIKVQNLQTTNKKIKDLKSKI